MNMSNVSMRITKKSDAYITSHLHVLSNSNLWAIYIGHDLDAKKKASRHLFLRQTETVMMAFASPEFQMDELMHGI